MHYFVALLLLSTFASSWGADGESKNPSSEAYRQCQPDFKWFDGCNNCGCSSDGVSYCSYKYCSPEQYIKDVHICQPGSAWKLGNKQCTCLKEGYGQCKDA